MVLDASAMVDLLLGAESAVAKRVRLLSGQLHAPAHFDAEVLSALGRLNRGGHLSAAAVSSLLPRVANARIQRHPVGQLLGGAWDRRNELSLADALYVELAERLGASVISTDDRLVAAAPIAENPAIG
ncbi:MAG: type II toxin-antitoxin system VapC family toxin [Acidimicrobiaceae bacterium]|nr:type II toxin-antitoxin system VapC family toxin [Acidimicrobiaceae bacterium]MYF43692.1 type II toxin-antitoxin system VapC family toxin [Acidimicrobiaceae bacterium]MYJ37070.1 type II toxin-antitoxin system VapC family toxin [Acidimicrobiaceae bacterium]